jgi:hypothetical protein
MSALVFVLASAMSGAIELTPANWDETIGSKAAFVKFLAPW